jgi:uncharacterized membrane protein YraQ (UPF0718 family)
MTNTLSILRRPFRPAWGIAVFALIALAGLFYVKWSPYYDRAFVAAQTHSIGHSILSGADGTLPAPSLQAALDYAVAYGLAIWKALVLGLLLGSALQALLPPHWVKRLLGGSNTASVVAAGLLAVPSMMCTCCSAPVIRGLRECQAASGSTVAYWIGNTMLNPATLIFMGFVLGWQWVGLRLALGIAMVLGLGWVLNRMNRNPDTMEAIPASASAPCEAPLDVATALSRWARAFFGMAWRLLPEYLILVLLLGAARAWLFPALDMSVGNSLPWILAAAVAGMLFVIPTAGEVPIVQTMLSLGLATGPAAALLMTLPPISLPSLAMVAKSFRWTELAAIVIGVVAFGIVGAGLAIALGF